MMDKTVLGGHIMGFKAVVSGIGSMLVAHLLFADDTFVFCDADRLQLDYLGQVLTWF